MGRRGPPPTPTATLRRRGSWLAKKRAGEPLPESGAPDPPADFDAAERKAWADLTWHLAAMHLLSKTDAVVLERYCRMLVRWRAADDFLKKHGEVYPLKDNQGDVRCFQPFPQVAIVSQLAAALLKIEQEFGLTPSARSRIGTVPKETRKNDPEKTKARFFKA